MKHFAFIILSSTSLLLTTIALWVSGNVTEIEMMGEVLLVFVIVIAVALVLTERYWTNTRSVET